MAAPPLPSSSWSPWSRCCSCFSDSGLAPMRCSDRPSVRGSLMFRLVLARRSCAGRCCCVRRRRARRMRRTHPNRRIWRRSCRPPPKRARSTSRGATSTAARRASSARKTRSTRSITSTCSSNTRRCPTARRFRTKSCKRFAPDRRPAPTSSFTFAIRTWRSRSSRSTTGNTSPTCRPTSMFYGNRSVILVSTILAEEYSTKDVPANKVPNSLAGLLAPEWKGKIATMPYQGVIGWYLGLQRGPRQRRHDRSSTPRSRPASAA